MTDPGAGRSSKAMRREDLGPDDDRPDVAGAADLDAEIVDAEILEDLDAAVDDAEILEDLDAAVDDDADEATFVDGTVGRSDLAAERDEYLEALQRVKAEFDNYRRRTEAQRLETGTRAAGELAEKLLPVLDACDAAVSHGAEEVEPVQSALLDSLGKAGLERLEPEGKPFDPNLHEAVMAEDGDDPETTVVEVLRAGYTWNGRVLRPAMVKVRG